MGIRSSLLQYFSAFPRGPGGIALLLLRLAAGLTIACHGGLCFWEQSSSAALWICGGLGLLGGFLLIFGFLTPVAASLAGIEAIGIALSVFPASSPAIFETKLTALLVAVISFAIALLGPGGLSIDARLFGRREIIIPLPSDS